jgi:hypothetical protein
MGSSYRMMKDVFKKSKNPSGKYEDPQTFMVVVKKFTNLFVISNEIFPKEL